MTGSVLIVDDMPANARLMAALLELDGHTLRTATDGAGVAAAG